MLKNDRCLQFLFLVVEKIQLEVGRRRVHRAATYELAQQVELGFSSRIGHVLLVVRLNVASVSDDAAVGWDDRVGEFIRAESVLTHTLI